jgi:hypothetical protein
VPVSDPCYELIDQSASLGERFGASKGMPSARSVVTSPKLNRFNYLGLVSSYE